MAFTPKTAFEARNTNNSRDNLANIAGLFQSGSPAANADCDAGTLCVRATRVPVEGMPAALNVLNENTWYMNAAASTVTANDVIYACNTYDNQLLPAPNGNQYFIGLDTLGLGAPAGRYCTFTRINFDDESVYRFGEGNVTITTTGDQYFTIDGGKLVSTDTEPSTAGDIYFTLRGTGSFTEGTTASFGYYDLVACVVKA